MAQPFELKFTANVAEVLSGLQQLADGVGAGVQAVAKMQETATAASTGITAVAEAAAAGAETIKVMAAASEEASAAQQSEVGELARLTELLGSEELARASLAARVIDMTATTVASDDEITASLERREAQMARVTAAQEARVAAEADAAAATVASADAEATATEAVQQVEAVAVSDATRLALAKGEMAEASAALRVQLEDLAQAQRNLAEIEAAEPGNLAAIARAQSELAAEATRVAEAEDVAAKAAERLAAAQAQAAKPPPLPTPAAGGGFTQQTQELGQLLTMLGLVDPQLLRVGVGVQMLGQSVETLAPMVAEAGGGIAGFVAVLGPVAVIAGAATVALGALAEAYAFVSASVKAAIPAQESETTFAVLLGNVEKARARLEELDATALKFHLDPDQLRAADAQLTRLSQGALGGGASINTLIEASARSQQPLAAVGSVIGRVYETIQNGSPIGRMGTQLVRMGVISQGALNELSNLQKEGAKGPEIWTAFEAAVNQAGGVTEARANTFQGATRGISTAWTEILEAFGRPIVDTLTPFLQKVSNGMAALVPYARDAGLVIGQFSGIILNSGSSLSLVAEILTGNFSMAIGHVTGLLLAASPLVHATFSFIAADVEGVFATVSATLIGFVTSTINTLTELFEKALTATAGFVNSMKGLLSALTGGVASAISSAVDGSVAGSKAMLDGLSAGMGTLSDKAKKMADDATANVGEAARKWKDALHAGQPAAPNEGKQFATPDPNASVTPDGKAGRGGGGGGSGKETDELTEATKRYKAALEDVKGALGAGDVSQEKATADQVKATQEYIATLTKMQAGLSPTSDRFQLLKSKIDEARASLLKLSEGTEQYERDLASTKAALDAGIISQAQAMAQDNKTIKEHIANLEATRAQVSATSAAYQDLTTKINQTQVKLANSTVWGSMRQRLIELKNEWGDLAKNVSSFVANQMNSAINGIAESIGNMAVGVDNAREAFQNFAKSAITGIVQLMLQQLASFALSKVLKSEDVATTVAANTAKTASSATTGLLESIATYGVNAAIGAVAFLAAMAVAGSFAEGGLIPGSPSHSDNRIAHVATGEYVIRTAAVQHWGPDLFHALNNLNFPLSMPAFAAGGLVGGGAAAMMAAAGNRERDRIINEIKVAGPKLNLFQVSNRAALLEAMRSSEGDAIILDSAHRQKHRMPFKK